MNLFLGDYESYFEPAPDIGIAEHSVRRIFNEEGRPFDMLSFPHLVAPGGPCDAFDASWVREIVLQWASRLGKTFFVLCGSLYLAELAPCNQILAGNIQDLAMQQMERIRKMGAYNPHFDRTRLQLSQKRRLDFAGNVLYAAWAKSAVTLSNINALFGGASELDLWARVSTSRHPDPEQMFGDRFKDNDSVRKEIYESIPTLSGTYVDEQGEERPRSRIEARRLRGTDCRLWVGCPLCTHRQVLHTQNVTADGYLCDGCGDVIGEDLRKTFIRSGVWAPRGCTVRAEAATYAANERLRCLEQAAELDEGDPELDVLRGRLRWHGWSDCEYIDGAPDNPGVRESFQLSSHYALSLSWARIHEQDWTTQNFVNQWEGETYDMPEDDVVDIVAEGRALADAITGELPQRVLPEWAQYLVLSCDRQKRTFPWMLSAWGDELERVAIVDSGVALSFDELEAVLMSKCGTSRVSWCVMDSGYLPRETYDWCLQMTKSHNIKCWPVKGDKGAYIPHDYKLADIEDEKKRKGKYRRLKRAHVNTQSTQEWAAKLLEDRTHVRLWKASHVALCSQLLNDAERIRPGSRVWDRIDTSVPNDQRDNLRYGYVGAQLARQHGKRSRRTMTMESHTSEAQRHVGPPERPVLTH